MTDSHTPTPANIAALGFTRQLDRDNRGDEDDAWEYVTEDGFRVVRITGASHPWLIFPPAAVGWRTAGARNLRKAAQTINYLRTNGAK